MPSFLLWVHFVPVTILLGFILIAAFVRSIRDPYFKLDATKMLVALFMFTLYFGTSLQGIFG